MSQNRPALKPRAARPGTTPCQPPGTAFTKRRHVRRLRFVCVSVGSLGFPHLQKQFLDGVSTRIDELCCCFFLIPHQKKIRGRSLFFGSVVWAFCGPCHRPPPPKKKQRRREVASFRFPFAERVPSKSDIPMLGFINCSSQWLVDTPM